MNTNDNNIKTGVLFLTSLYFSKINSLILIIFFFRVRFKNRKTSKKKK